MTARRRPEPAAGRRGRGASAPAIASAAPFALVRRARLRPGETVLVTGASGGVGAAGVRLAKAFGARVIAVIRDETRLAAACDLGADHILPTDPAALRDRVRDLTGGRGADVMLETVVGDVFRAALRATAWEGRLVVIGFASGEIPEIKAGHVLVKNISVLGLQFMRWFRPFDPRFVEGPAGGLLNNGPLE